jgi:L-ascorbate metabolism protein UlaG (beta-lactamase superfamily)
VSGDDERVDASRCAPAWCDQAVGSASMRLTKLAHAGVRLVKDGVTLVIDPGGFGSGTEALAEADAVLITHEHADHLDADALRIALDAQPGLRVWSNPAVADQLGSFRGRVNRVRHGDAFTAAGFEVHVHGAEHALSHPEIPVVPNTGFLVEGEVFHPGDALTVPAEPVPTLLVPVCAPWLKSAEFVDYFRQVNPRRGFAIHDAMLSEFGLMVLAGYLDFAADGREAELARLEPGTTIDL